jgi:hypothetical protein
VEIFDEIFESQERRPLPTYMCTTFPYICKFWLTVHEVALEYRKPPASKEHANLLLRFTESIYRELLTWAEALPESIAQSEGSPPHVMTSQ